MLQGLLQLVVLGPFIISVQPSLVTAVLRSQAARKGAQTARLAVYHVSLLIFPAALGQSIPDRRQRSLPSSQAEVLHQGEVLMHLPGGELRL